MYIKGELWRGISPDWIGIKTWTLDELDFIKLDLHRALACLKQSKVKGETTILVAKGPYALVEVTSSLH